MRSLAVLATLLVLTGGLSVLTSCSDVDEAADGVGGAGSGATTCTNDSCGGAGGETVAGAGGAGGGEDCVQNLVSFEAGACRQAAESQCCPMLSECEDTPGCPSALICALSPNAGPCPETPLANEILACLRAVEACPPPFGICTSGVTINEDCDDCLGRAGAEGGCCELFVAASDADADGFIDCLNGVTTCDEIEQAAVTCAAKECNSVCPVLGN